METVERQRGLQPDHGQPGRLKGRAQDNHDRRELSEGALHGVEPVRKKRGARAPDRAYQRWDEHQTSRRCRRQGAPDRVLHVGRSAQRLHRRGRFAEQPAEGGLVAGRSGL